MRVIGCYYKDRWVEFSLEGTAYYPFVRARVVRKVGPALATRRWSSKVIWMLSGWLCGGIYWVLLVSGRFCVSKTIIPEAQKHFLTPSARRDTYLFGGLGLTLLVTMSNPGEPDGEVPSS